MSYYLLSNAYLIQNNYLTPDRHSVKNISESYMKMDKSKHIIKLNKNYIKKKFMDKYLYFIEKTCYQRLINEKHFAKLLKYDDKNMILYLSFVGNSIPEPIKHDIDILNLKQQINEITNILLKHKIQHNDIHIRNILIKDKILYLIDFEWASDLSEVPVWKSYTRKIPKGVYKTFPKVINETKFIDYIVKHEMDKIYYLNFD